MTLTPTALPRAPHSALQPPWLLLVYQLPARPSNARVKTWRRLQKVGALGVKSSVYVLPNSSQAREDFEWIKAEILAMKGQASVFAAEEVDSLAGEEILAGFRRARQQDFEGVRRQAAKWLAARRSRPLKGLLRRRAERAVRLLRDRWEQIAAIDFFGSPGREEAAAALDDLARQLERATAPPAPVQPTAEPLNPDSFRERVWVTRPRPGIDRMASAWLIRRFIDPRAEFRFAEAPDRAAEAVPFDMFGVEFSHHANHCTFETLMDRFRIRGAAVEWLSRLVHELDLKDERYAVPETAAIGRLVDGLRQICPDDNELLERGMTMFEALYRSYAGAPAQGTGPARTLRPVRRPR